MIGSPEPIQPWGSDEMFPLVLPILPEVGSILEQKPSLCSVAWPHLLAWGLERQANRKLTGRSYSIDQWWPVIVPFVNRQDDEWTPGSFPCPRPCRNKWDVPQSSKCASHRTLFKEALKGPHRYLARRLWALGPFSGWIQRLQACLPVLPVGAGLIL